MKRMNFFIKNYDLVFIFINGKKTNFYHSVNFYEKHRFGFVKKVQICILMKNTYLVLLKRFRSIF